MANSPRPSRLLVTTIIRHSQHDQKSAFARVVDLSAGRVVTKATVPESLLRAADPNPRGGRRGARGVVVTADRVLLAVAERVMIFDHSWKRVGELSHPLGGGIHDIIADPDGVWIASTAADLLIKLDWNSRLIDEWEWRKDKALVRALGFHDVPPVDRKVDYRQPDAAREAVRNLVHLNCVARGSSGLLVSMGRVLSPSAFRRARIGARFGRLAKLIGTPHGWRARFGIASEAARKPQGFANRIGGSSSAIVSVQRDGQAVVLARATNTMVPNHNVAQVGDAFLYNDSNNGRLVEVRPGPPYRQRSVQIPGQPSFARGLVILNGTRVVVGNAGPAAVHEVDLTDMRVVSSVSFAGEREESVYAIAILPDSLNAPPATLE